MNLPPMAKIISWNFHSDSTEGIKILKFHAWVQNFNLMKQSCYPGMAE